MTLIKEKIFGQGRPADSKDDWILRVPPIARPRLRVRPYVHYSEVPDNGRHSREGLRHPLAKPRRNLLKRILSI